MKKVTVKNITLGFVGCLSALALIVSLGGCCHSDYGATTSTTPSSADATYQPAPAPTSSSSFVVTPVPVRSGFLTTYRDMEQRDASTWRYLDPNNRMANYSRFVINPVKIMVSEFEGRPVLPEAARAAQEYMRSAMVEAISPRYPVVSAAGVTVGEIRAAITEAFRAGGHVGMALEVELVDSYSGKPIGSAVTAELNRKWSGEEWDDTAIKEIMDDWAARIRLAIDNAHGM